VSTNAVSTKKIVSLLSIIFFVVILLLG
jgi:hypothetical protein